MSVDLIRSQPLVESSIAEPVGPIPRAPRRLTHAQTAERLALARWPANHHLYVCSVAGGTGRTTVAGLVALTLAGLPYAELHRPIVLGEFEYTPLSRARQRWGAQDSDTIQVGNKGARISLADNVFDPPEVRPLVVIDTPSGLLTTDRVTAAEASVSVVLLTRPDRTSLAETAEALLWLQDNRGVARRRLTVLINEGTGIRDRGSRPAGPALGIRCSSIHRLPAHAALGPGRVLRSHQEPAGVRRAVIGLCLDIYRSIQPAVSPTAPPKEDSNA